jgi:hypothetical protein
MELFSLIINLAAELAKLARTLLTDGMRFMALLSRSRTALATDTEQSSIGSRVPESWCYGRFIT